MEEEKKWYEKFKSIDFEPILWFFLSTIYIFVGYVLNITENEAIGTLFIALGGIAMRRVRGKEKENGGQPIK